MSQILKFLPLLFIYLAFIALVPYTSGTDEAHFLRFARNLAQGFYAGKSDLDLWFGPGYPLLLAPFVALHIPRIMPLYLNGFLMFGAVIYFYLTLSQYIERNRALVCAVLFGLYPTFFRHIHTLMSETFVIFLVCGFMYHFVTVLRGENILRLHFVLSIVYLSVLILTKVIFAYVIPVVVVMSGFFWFTKYKLASAKTIGIGVLSILMCLPYLIYTYSITGKMYYWSNSGGVLLYWMSTPHEEEYGDWHPFFEVYKNQDLYKNHHELFDSLSNLNLVERDERFKSIAIENIRNNTGKYFRNIMCNLGRMLFSYPYSYTLQKPSTYLYIVPMISLLVLLINSFLVISAKRVIVPIELWILLGIVAVYIGGSSLLHAAERQFRIMIPLLLLFAFYTLHGFLMQIKRDS